MLAFYNLIPKWLLLIMIAALLVSGIFVGIKMEYYKIDNAKLTNDNKIYADNEKVYQAELLTCQQSLQAEANNAQRTEAIHKDTSQYNDEIKQICVKEEGNEKTDIKDAIAESNKLSVRFNSAGLRGADQSDQNGASGKLYVAPSTYSDYDPGHGNSGANDPGPIKRQK